MRTVLDTGCHIVALAVKAACVDMVAAYPITPQTSVVEEIASLVDRGEMDARFLSVEGEHSAMAACVAASAVGARVFTATSSQGLLYMHEVLHMAAGGRLPIVMVNVNRSIFAPWSVMTDHHDSLSQRDTGWIQLYCSSLQEIFDTIIQAFKIAETLNLPVMVNFDGFILSHCTMAVQIPSQDIIDSFLPVYQPKWRLDSEMPNTFAAVTPASEYPQFRELLARDLETAKTTIADIALDYERLTGLSHGGLLDLYRSEDAEVFIISMGSMAGEARLSVEMLRREGIKAGNIRLRVFRPFPGEALSDVLPEGVLLVALDRNYAFGTGGGTIFAEVKSALYGRRGDVSVANSIMGIGGTDVTAEDMADEVRKHLKRSR